MRFITCLLAPTALGFPMLKMLDVELNINLYIEQIMFNACGEKYEGSTGNRWLLSQYIIRIREIVFRDFISLLSWKRPVKVALDFCSTAEGLLVRVS